MNEMPLREISDDDVRRFEDDGVVRLEGMFDSDWLTRMAALVEDDLADPGPLNM